MTEPVPATGPYRIESWDPKVGMTLVRNDAFHVWSQAAQPDGFPDRIQFTSGVSRGQQVEDVESGRADWMMDVPPNDDPAHPHHQVRGPGPPVPLDLEHAFSTSTRPCLPSTTFWPGRR